MGPRRGPLGPSQRVANLERRISGLKTTPSPVPPSFVQRPWNSFTFERTDTSTGSLQLIDITVGDILEQIRGRVGLQPLSSETPANVRVKLQSSQVWCTAASLLQPDVEVNFYGVSSAAAGPRSTQRDIGTLNMPAKCGYIFPLPDQKELLYNDQAAELVVSAQPVAIGSLVTFRIQVLWQSSL